MKKQVLFSVLMTALLALSLAAPLASAQTTPAEEPGLVIVRVDAEGPAAQAGVKRGDILLAVDGQEINNSLDWFRVLRSLETGKTLELQVLHGDETRTVEATVGQSNSRPYLGLQVYLGGAAETAAGPEEALPLATILAGTRVVEVVADSPASAAGLQAGDVITAVDGKALDAESNLADVIGSYQPGDEVTLTVARPGGEGETEELVVTLGENPNDATRAFLGIRYTNALEVQGLPEQLAPFFGQGRGQRMPFAPSAPFGQTTPDQQTMPDVTEAAGAVVRSVAADSPAADAGLQVGDLLTAIDGEAVDSPQALVDAVGARQPGDVVTLTVTRTGQSQPLKVEVTLGENPETAGKAYMGVSIGAAMIRMLRQQQGQPGSFQFQLPFGLGDFQFDLDQLPFDLDQLPFELPLPGMQQQAPDQSGA